MEDDKKTQDESPEPQEDDGKTINDPLTRDVEAPRKEFEGRRPE
jgi:hypothetical protein